MPKVFIVDDDAFLLEMYAMKFKKNGYEVDTALMPDLALQKLANEPTKPDILVLDVVMPKMDGLELLSEIKQKQLVPDATVVILTNQSQPADIQRAKELKVDGYVVKATTIPSEVVEEVRKIHANKRKS